jgi:hypothetical protein
MTSPHKKIVLDIKSMGLTVRKSSYPYTSRIDIQYVITVYSQ